MENATKALIIAGAILVSILIISIGIVIVNAAAGVQDEAVGRMDQQAIQTFNSTFLNYVGTQRGVNVKTLMQEVIASNASHGEEQKVDVDGGDLGTTPNDVMSNVKSSTRYQVKVEIDEEGTGLVKKIIISSTSGTVTPP